MFKRWGATHGLGFVKPEEELHIEEYEFPFSRPKLLVEEKTSGINLRDTKLLRSNDYVFKHHRHWGGNIALGGKGNFRETGQQIDADGSHGHLYIYSMSPKAGEPGGIMVGLEGSEFGKYDLLGNKHTINAHSAPISPTFGYKWHAKKDFSLDDDPTVQGPGKYDCMFVDLSTGWDFLINKYENWHDEWVKDTSLPIPDDPNWYKLEGNKPTIVSNLPSHLLQEWKKSVEYRKEFYLDQEEMHSKIAEKPITDNNK
eukprot:CAMPEP_0117422528 /NCGR_PEP_ID=MMETSP0758-20121206/3345_1 /TAXON_ID=63605 /ORGANISM="Percolomonas cosmopolitus, Strain AE-1 (ATCC 50343)" /LENGTH=255 /DNA_ID=CAMNT_0005205193 /DNA_START=511 /DNA_END=1278 /DNA_ORIENTATION=-